MKIQAHTDKIVVVDLKKEMIEVQLDEGEFTVDILRAHPDHLELVCIICSSTSGGRHKKTLKFYYSDMITMNRTLHRIMHPLKHNGC